MRRKTDIFQFNSFGLWVEFLSVALIFSFALVLLAPLSGYEVGSSAAAVTEWTDTSEVNESSDERSTISVVILEEHVHGQGVIVKESVTTLIARPFQYHLTVPSTFKSDRTPPPERA